MIASLFAGISGLNANASALTVIGDNIANVNTIAFKSNSSAFANILSTSLDGSLSGGVGRGVDLWGINPTWSQGTLENTNSPTDLAINGKGFFIVHDDSGTPFYTRAGQFHFDKLGYMTNPDGLRLQGYQIDSSGNLGSPTDIYLPGERTSPPSATTEFSFDINLDATATVGDTFTSSQTIYDSLGNAIELNLTFTNQAAGQWECEASIPVSVGGALPNVLIDGAQVLDVEFDADGVMIDPVPPDDPRRNGPWSYRSP